MCLRTGTHLTATLEAGAKFDIGVLLVDIAATGTISGYATQIHSMREQEELFGYSTQADSEVSVSSIETVTGLVVTPRSEAGLDAAIWADLIFDIILPIVGTVHLGGRLFDLDVPIATYAPGPWDEPHRLRIGTATGRGGNVRRGSWATSHWPSRSSFASFGSSTSQL